MHNITLNEKRVGRFTSSEIARLMKVARDKVGFGEPALSYIAEKNIERRLGRSLNVESNAKPLSWGKLVEQRVFDLLGTEYSLCSSETIEHPIHSELWSGSPDMQKHDEGGTVVDIKCPITLKSFCVFSDCNNIDEVREMHDDGEKYYWQLVSNAILTGSKYAELIVYCPYQSELVHIRDMASNFYGDQNKVAWVNWSNDEDLPYLPDGGYYKSIKIIRFEVPQSDKNLLTIKVLAASMMLQKNTPETEVVVER
jgi:hypothetical protein